ncbi:LexA repressor [Clostridium tepidiprofundi DSM 19306]|uniref:DNA 3'-5' helicase n=1 Tax=Clostridium tepidiprofundi DSM 19306 TaxID=1121338 RepID=A0A151B347_9CLOT|nr:S24 family peptidase [Clostridium tepidiprofundi]KYH34338.1 LexA repressor [Clostridium tepidiprofundi DSM 19306]
MQLNIEQRKLIQAKPSGHVLIKGVAGSGKTTVAVHRILFLQDNYCIEEDDNILFITYNKTLVNYISHIYANIKKDADEYGNFLSQNNVKPEICTIDSIMYHYFKRFKENSKYKYNITWDNSLKNSILKQSIVELQKKYSDVKLLDIVNTKFLSDEIDWIKSCNYMEFDEYQSVDRIGRMSNNKSEGPQKLMKNSRTREAIFELMLLYDKKLKEKGYIDFKSMALLALHEGKKGIEKKYTHIIVDECQDLTRVQLEFISLLNKEKAYSSILFAADTAQSIYTHAWLTKGRSFSSIGFDMKGKSNTLAKNYRTTTQIAEAAYSLLEGDENIIEDSNFVKPSLIDRQGVYPVCKVFNNESDEARFVVKTVKSELIKKFKYKDIVIIAKNRNQLTYIKSYFDKAGVPADIITRNETKFDVDSVKLLTIHSMKGLESKVVMIIGINQGVIPYFTYKSSEDAEMQETMERKLLYVGMTRANELLYMTSSGAPSKFIGEINPSYLKMDSNINMSRFYRVDVDEYLFRENIVDIFSKEEAVRQYVIKELIEKYKYPKELIEIEYKINSFSKMGSADILVSRYENNSKIPYIIIETKAYGAGIEEAFSQLKSYMSNLNCCEYGVATDGNEILVINNKFEKVQYIPPFSSNMLPSTLENYTYIDLKHNNREYVLTIDSTMPNYLYVKSKDGSEEFTEENLKSVVVFDNIAAGKPIYMCDDVNGKFYIPKEWLSNNKDTFILRIKGNSMINANINDGDYVVLEKCQTVDNYQIAAVAIDENATLKRVVKMGDSVLLLAENKDYEPIQVSSEQVNILGVAIGIIHIKK